MSWHRVVDRAFAGTVLPPLRLYPDGFGARARLDELVRAVHEVGGASAPATLRWSRPRRVGSAQVRRGWFRSPCAHLLPPESREGLVEEWEPAEQGERAPVCLLLAATAEEGFARRRVLARALARHGVASWSLENPFYGARRPAGQRGSSLRTVADQFAMNLSTVEEARALLAAIHAAGRQPGVSGYSQGGVMAAFAAALSPFPVVAAPRGASRSAEPIFMSGVLTRTMRWDVLAAEAGGFEPAQAVFRDALAPVRLDRYAPPVDPSLAILLSARDDGFVPASEAEALRDHWAGSELRWLPAGHVTAVVLHGRAQLGAILDAFARAAGRPITRE